MYSRCVRRMTERIAAESFGLLLKGYRLSAGLSQEELAERAGLSRRGVSDLERGARRNPRLASVRRLAEAMGLGEADRARLLGAVHGMSGPEVPDPRDTRAMAHALSEPPTPLLGREHDLGA